MKKTGKLLTMLLAVVMILAAMATPAFAADTSPQELTVTDTTANGTFSVDKYVVVDKDTNIPEQTFTFSFGPVEAGSDMIYNGQKVLSGTDTIQHGQATVTFANTDTTTLGSTDTDTAGITTGGANQKYVKKAVTLSLEGATFTKPGTYCYLVKETNGSTAGMAYSRAQYFVMVFVGYDNTNANAGPLSILGINTVKSTDENGRYIYSETSTKSTAQFINAFVADNLQISKAVTGNMGDRNKDFSFSLTVSPNALLITNAKLTAVKTTANGNTTAEVTVGTPYTFTLKHGEKLEIKGLPQGTRYTVAETDYSSESYTTSLITTAGEVVSESTEVRTSDNQIADGGNTEAFTNNKNITIPTGILLEVWPYALVVLLAIGGALLMISKKRRSTVK